MKFRVNVQDKIGKIGESIEKVSGKAGYILFNGKLCNLDDDTF